MFKSVKEWIPFVIVTLVVFAAIFLYTTRSESDDIYAPLEINELRVEPNPLVIGKPAVLHNGYCNNSKVDINVQIYFGAQRVVQDPLLQADVVDLLRDPDGTPIRDTAESRRRQNLAPGCTANIPIQVPSVPPILPPGDWRLQLHLVATSPSNEIQHVIKLSPPFRVVNDVTVE